MKFFSDISADLHEIAPVGLALGMGSFKTGQIDVRTTYKEEWQELYDANGWLAHDPAVRAGLRGQGVRGWTAEAAGNEVFKNSCLDFGLRSGISICDSISGSSCIAGLTTNREISAAAIEASQYAVREAHMRFLTGKASLLSRQHVDVVFLSAKGLRAKEIAGKLDISEETVKQRKSSVQRQLGVNNFLAAVNICAVAGLTIHPIK